MTKKKEDYPFFIYPGERRPVVVAAKNARHARDKILKSPEYDGFPVYIYPIEKFAEECAGLLVDKNEIKVELEPPQERYIVITSKAGIPVDLSEMDSDVLAVDAAARILRVINDFSDVRVFRIMNGKWSLFHVPKK